MSSPQEPESKTPLLSIIALLGIFAFFTLGTPEGNFALTCAQANTTQPNPQENDSYKVDVFQNQTYPLLNTAKKK